MIRTFTVSGCVWLTLTMLAPGFAQEPSQPAASSQAGEEAPGLTDDKGKTSYAVGMNLGHAIRRDSADLDVNLIVQGLRDAFSGGETRLGQTEMRAILQRMQGELKARQTAHQNERTSRTSSQGEAFLAGNKAKEGVVALDSGLQYKVLKAGDGRKPTIDDTVVCHYRGTLIDGTEFDSSYRRNKPATFALRRVIKGWTEALELMPVGSTWQLFIPPALGYGTRGAGKSVPPNATLVFEVELLAIQGSTANPIAASDRKNSDSAGIDIAFKLDPRLTKGIWLGERWVSAPYTQVGVDKTRVTVHARAEGLDGAGKRVTISPTWTTEDPELARVTPGQGNDVEIAVLRPGKGRLRVVSGRVSRELVISAVHRGEALQVEISDLQ